MAEAKHWHASQVVAATEIPTDTLRRWLDRRVIVLNGADIDPGGSGRPRQFGLRSVYRIAVLHRLVRAGLNPASALTLAKLFCDTSQPSRPHGELFSGGRTLLVVDPNGNGRILHLPPDQIIDEVLTADVSIVVDLGKIVRHVDERLGLSAASNRNVDSIINEFNQPHLKANNVQH